MTTQPKTRAELQADASTLHGLLQGVQILQNEAEGADPIHNAIFSMTQIAAQKAGELNNALDSAQEVMA